MINEGSITAGPGGSVTLLGGRVSNSGSIVADFGTVNLAAGRAATLDLAGDGLLRLEVGSDLLSNASGAASAVENSGSIQANGGQVLLTANAVQGRVREPHQQHGRRARESHRQHGRRHPSDRARKARAFERHARCVRG